MCVSDCACEGMRIGGARTDVELDVFKVLLEGDEVFVGCGGFVVIGLRHGCEVWGETALVRQRRGVSCAS